jgi:hypothetical protein
VIERANFLVTSGFLHTRDTNSGQEAITADQLAGSSYPARRTGEFIALAMLVEISDITRFGSAPQAGQLGRADPDGPRLTGIRLMVGQRADTPRALPTLGWRC